MSINLSFFNSAANDEPASRARADSNTSGSSGSWWDQHFTFLSNLLPDISLIHCYYFSESLDVAARAAAEENKRNEEVLRWLSPILMCSVLTLCWHQPWLILGWKGHSRRRIFCLFQKTMMLTRMKPLPDLVWSPGGQGKKNHLKIWSWWMGVENSNCIYKDYHCIPGMRGWLMKRGVSKPEG